MLLEKRVVGYVARTMEKKIFFARSTINSSPLTAYSDSDWAGWNDTRRSKTGILITISEAPVSWTYKMQTMIALPSAEAEYIVLSTYAKEVIHLVRLFMELAINQPIINEQLASTYIFTGST